jgi:hypothetical protein
LTAILSSLVAFFAAGLRPRTPLAKAIVMVLTVKLIGILCFKFLSFPDSARPAADANAITRLIGLPVSQTHPIDGP